MGEQKEFNVAWFEGVNLNYAEHIFRNFTGERPAIVFKTESGSINEMSWEELQNKTASLQQHFRAWKIAAGDRVVALLPCIPEATVAMLATVSLGAVWSSCSPDFGTSAVLDRFAQTNPKVLIATDRYNYGGKSYDKTAVVQELIKSLPTLEKIILISENPAGEFLDKPVVPWQDLTSQKAEALQVVRVPFSNPLWILYSSGTTGLPKAFVHSHGGILLEQLKYGTFHNDFKPGERCFWYTTTGWMMWNYIHGSLLAGATMVLYDGSVGYPDMNTLWKFAQDAHIHHFGTSAAYLLANMKENVHPAADFDLLVLRSISSTGSTLPPEAFHWAYREIKKDLWLVSMSGGSDVCSAFVGGNPTWPVHAGEIQCRALGCNLQAFDEEGRAVLGEVGEAAAGHACARRRDRSGARQHRRLGAEGGGEAVEIGAQAIAGQRARAHREAFGQTDSALVGAVGVDLTGRSDERLHRHDAGVCKLACIFLAGVLLELHAGVDRDLRVERLRRSGVGNRLLAAAAEEEDQGDRSAHRSHATQGVGQRPTAANQPNR